MSRSTRTTLLTNPKRVAAKKMRQSSSAKMETMAANITTYTQSERTVIINEFIKSLDHVSPPRYRAVSDCLTDNVRNSCSATNTNGIAAAVKNVHFDHNGYPV